ncbi:unnamed protein product [Prunus brigantina]
MQKLSLSSMYSIIHTYKGRMEMMWLIESKHDSSPASSTNKDIGRDLRPCGCCQAVNQHHAGRCCSNLLGSYMQSAFPAVIKIVIPFAPLFAVLAASLLACSVFFENVVRLKASMVAVTLQADLSLMAHAQTVLSGEIGVVFLSVLLVHIAGFFVALVFQFCFGFGQIGNKDIKILFLNFIVGMQNSSSGVVLATSHFTLPMVALLAALSAVIMNIMGSSLAFFWRYVDPSDSKETPTVEVE